MPLVYIQSAWLETTGSYMLFLLKNGVVQNLGGTALAHISNWYFSANVPITLSGRYDAIVTENMEPILESVLQADSVIIGNFSGSATLSNQTTIINQLATLQSSITAATPEIYNLYSIDPVSFLAVPDVRCHLTYDVRGISRATEEIYSDNTGLTTFFVRPGDYFLWRYHPSVVFKNPAFVSVTAQS